MTEMLTHVLLSVTRIEYSLSYVASSRQTSKGTKTVAKGAIVTLEAITIYGYDPVMGSKRYEFKE